MLNFVSQIVTECVTKFKKSYLLQYIVRFLVPLLQGLCRFCTSTMGIGYIIIITEIFRVA